MPFVILDSRNGHSEVAEAPTREAAQQVADTLNGILVGRHWSSYGVVWSGAVRYYVDEATDTNDDGGPS